jgi:hypothetical protein
MSNNKQQTAVEWFFEQLTEVDYNCINKTFLQNNNSLAGYKLRELLDQAKEMDKEQKIRDFTDGYLYRGEQLRPWLIDKWYNETYGGNK